MLRCPNEDRDHRHDDIISTALTEFERASITLIGERLGQSTASMPPCLPLQGARDFAHDLL
jgi:hypothetical protein